MRINTYIKHYIKQSGTDPHSVRFFVNTVPELNSWCWHFSLSKRWGRASVPWTTGDARCKNVHCQATDRAGDREVGGTQYTREIGPGFTQPATGKRSRSSRWDIVWRCQHAASIRLPMLLMMFSEGVKWHVKTHPASAQNSVLLIWFYFRVFTCASFVAHNLMLSVRRCLMLKANGP